MLSSVAWQARAIIILVSGMGSKTMRQSELLGSIESHQLEIVPRADCILKVEGTSATGQDGENLGKQTRVAVNRFK